MEFIFFLIIIALVVVIIRQNKRNRQTQAELNELKRRVLDLDEKSLFMYKCLKDIGAVPNFSPSHTQTQADTAPAAQTTPAVETISADQTKTSVEGNLTVERSHIVENISPVQEAPMAEENSPVQASPKVENYSTVQQTPAYTPAYAKTAPKQRKNIEEWLGSRLLGAAASVLIFIGLIMFCTLGTDSVTNTMKMAAMFTVSVGAAAAGAFMLRKERSSFPLVLMGCGFGMFFISILISHVYFEVLGEIAAFGLILIWTAAAMLLSKKYDSVMLSVTAHLGAAISIVFAYSFAFSQEKAVIISVYELASICVLTAGNIFCSKKTYRFGLLLSQVLIVFTTIRTNIYFINKITPQIIIPTIIIYIVHIAAISFISYLLSVSANDAADPENALLFKLVHGVNKTLWATGTAAGIVFVTSEIIGSGMYISWLAVCAAAAAHLTVTVYFTKKLGFSETLTGVTTAVITIMISAALYIGTLDKGLPFFFAYALLLALLHYKTSLSCFAKAAAPVLVLDAFYMCVYGYSTVKNIFISTPYLAAIITSAILLWFSLDTNYKKCAFAALKIFSYVTVYFSIISIIPAQFHENTDALIVITLSVINLICGFTKFAPRSEVITRRLVGIGTFINILIGIIHLEIDFSYLSNDTVAATIVMTIMLLIITALFSYDLAHSSKTILQITAAALPALVITAAADCFDPYSIFIRVFTETLCSREILFIFIASLSVIYYKNNNKKLRPVLFISLICEMMSMGLFGYFDVEWYKEKHIIIYLVIIVYLIIHSTAMLYFSNRMISITDKLGEKTTSSAAFYLSYIWALFSLPMITYINAAKEPLDFVAASAVQLIINILLHTLISRRVEQAKHGYLDRNALVISAIVLYIGMMELSMAESTNAVQYAAVTVLFLACAANLIVMAMYLLPLKNTVAEIFIGLTATVLINCTCIGLSNDFDFTYIFSIITMLIALACIVYGFIARAKGMRMYGLAVVVICTVKLVTVDIIAADSLARVMAFIIGGIVCFVISGIYSAMEKKIANAKISIENGNKK